MPVEDAELSHSASAFTITKQLERMITMYQNSAYKRRPIIYTRPSWVQNHMLPVADWYEDVYWWMAAYTFTGQEASENLLVSNMERFAPAIPMDKVIIHQVSEKGRGSAYGVRSEKLDYNRFRGTQAQWNDVFGEPTTPPVPGPDPGPTPVTVIVKAGEAVVTVIEE